MSIRFTADPFPSNAELNELFALVWDTIEPRDFGSILSKSLVHVAAMDGRRLVGFVNVATDGGIHAFLIDTSVLADYRDQGIGRRMVKIAIDLSRQRGATWLHVDYEPHLAHFYQQCGFGPTTAGLIDLTKPRA
jgi:GNAT superfamily N-acetyltransferase